MKTYAAGADFAFVSDSSAIVVVETNDRIHKVAEVHELRPTRKEPLKPSAVVAAFVPILERYRIRMVTADGHYAESIREQLAQHHIRLDAIPTGQNGKAETYVLARTIFRERRIRLLSHPRLVAQLKSVVSKPTPGGGLAISSPRKAGGGHGDLVSALVCALWAAEQRCGGGELAEQLRRSIDRMDRMPSRWGNGWDGLSRQRGWW